MPRLILVLIGMLLCGLLFAAVLYYVTPSPAYASAASPHAFYEYGDLAYDPAVSSSFGTNGAVFQHTGILTVRDNDVSLPITVCRFNAYDATVPSICKTITGNSAWFVDGSYTYTVSGLNRGWLHYYSTPSYNVPVTGWFSTYAPLIVR
jgi:hypothetical protein